MTACSCLCRAVTESLDLSEEELGGQQEGRSYVTIASAQSPPWSKGRCSVLDDPGSPFTLFRIPPKPFLSTLSSSGFFSLPLHPFFFV